MGEPQSQINRLNDQMQVAVLQIKDIVGELKSYQLTQKYIQEDLEEVRNTVKAINLLLREGEPSFVTRVLLLERRVDMIEASRRLGREWWFKVLGSLTVAVIFAIAGAFLALYITSKGGVLKP